MRHNPISDHTDEADILQQDAAELRQKLSMHRDNLGHEQALLKGVTEWLVIARELPAASAREHISKRTAELTRGNAMYRTPGTTDGRDEFPDDCEGCPHYEAGAACPVFADYGTERQLQQIMEHIEDPVRRRQRLRRLAADNQCHILEDAVERVSTAYEPLVKRGQILLMVVEDRLIFHDAESEIEQSITNAMEFDISPGAFEGADVIRGDPEVGLFEPRDGDEPELDDGTASVADAGAD